MSAPALRAASEPPVAAPSFRTGPLLAAIVVVALIARLAFAFAAPPRILWPDGREFEQVALSLLRHEGYGLQTLRPPGYPTLMAAVWSVTGHDLRALRIVEAVIGACAVWGIARVGIRRFGPAAGLIAAGLAAIHPVFVYLPSTEYSENTLVTLMVGVFAVLLAALAPGGRRLGHWAAAGLLLGVAMLWRPNMVLLLPGLVIGTAWHLARARRPFVVPLLVLGLGAGTVIAPWVIRCHAVHHQWYFIATGGGRALWLGANPQLAHGPYTITFPDSATALRVTAVPGDFAYDAAMRREGLTWMGAHPADAAALYGRKLAHLFALFPATFTPSPYMNRRSQAAQGAVSLVIFAGAVLGLSRLRRAPELGPLMAGVVSFGLLTAVFYAVLRYRMPVEPVLLWLAGIGWAGAWLARHREAR